MPCELFSFATECDIPNWLTMILELVIGLGFGYLIALKFRSKVTEDVVKKLQKKEQTRDIQLLTDSLASLTKIWELTEGVCHWANKKIFFLHNIKI